MRKFSGNINGKSYNDEKEFIKDVFKVFNTSDGNISISTSYTSCEDTDNKKSDNKKSDVFVVTTDDITSPDNYLLVSSEFKYKLQHISDDNRNDIIRFVKSGIKDSRELDKELESKRLKLKGELDELEVEIDDNIAFHNYYTEILNILNENESSKTDCDCDDCDCDDKCSDNNCQCCSSTEKNKNDYDDFSSFLDLLGFWFS